MEVYAVHTRQHTFLGHLRANDVDDAMAKAQKRWGLAFSVRHAWQLNYDRNIV